MEIVAAAGFDWVLIDCEHGPNDLPLVLQQLQAVAAFPTEPIVRLPNHNADLIKQYLDVGARSLLIPMVESALQAKEIVRATRYPPDGVRGYSMAPRASGYGRVAGYHANASDNVLVVAQIESPAACAAASEIAAIEGIDALFVGPGDLSASMGHLGNPNAVEVQQAIQQVFLAGKDAGKPMGILAPTKADADRYIEWGYTMVSIGSDAGLLRNGSDSLIAGLRTKFTTEKLEQSAESKSDATAQS